MIEPQQSASTTGTRTTGIVIVDHGSRRAASNEMLESFVEVFRQNGSYSIVEPAHMELAEPSIATAFGRCVAQGAERVVVMPYFLLPGRHWQDDIPHLAAAAAERHPGVPYLVGAPFGHHPLIHEVVSSRLAHCLLQADGRASECEICAGSGGCQFRLS